MGGNGHRLLQDVVCYRRLDPPQTKEQEEAGTSATGSNEEEDATDCISFKRVFLHVYGKINFKGNVMFELKPSFKSIHKSFQDVFDEFLQM